MELKEGKIKKILFLNESDWGRFSFKTLDEEMLIVGVIPDASVGMKVKLEGIYETNKYGTQFVIKNVLEREQDEFAGLRSFLADGYIKGVGPVTANSIVETLGNRFFEIMDDEEIDDKTRFSELAMVKGISKKKAKDIYESYLGSRSIKDIVLYLNGAGTKNQVENIYRKLGDTAIKVIKKNPYILITEVDGFGFLKADKLALASGIKPNSIERISGAINHVISEAENSEGHCYLTAIQLKDGVLKLLAPMPKMETISNIVAENVVAKGFENFVEAKEKLIKAHNPSQEDINSLASIVEMRHDFETRFYDAINFAIENDLLVNDDGKMYTKRMYVTEQKVAQILADMVKGKSNRFITKETIESCIKKVEDRKTEELQKENPHAVFKITKEQRDAVYLGAMNRVAIISGGPGRGKTAITEIIVETFMSSSYKYDKRDVIMVAPTGKAAKRITESTGYEASTIHRLVAKYEHSDEKLSKKLVIADESSMIDISLLLRLLKTVKDCNLIFVGDVDQIPSVGAGMVLKDLIKSGKIPTILLKEGHRNSGSIANNSQLINAGYKLDSYTYDNAFHYTPASTDNILDLTLRKYIEKVKEYGIENVMLTVPMNERGTTSVKALNTSVQELFTKGRKEIRVGNKLFRLGDRVMQTKNNYNFKILRNNIVDLGIFNGDIGTIVKIDKQDDLDRLVVKFDDGSIGAFSTVTAKDLILAYAITQHKCQGSEAKCVIIAYTYADYILLNRALFYTAVTRAKKEIYLFAEEKLKYGKLLSAIDVAINNVDVQHRNTALAQRINELL